MLALPTAKVLLFIAINVGPHHVQSVYATSQSEGYVWNATGPGWTLEAQGFPGSDFTRDPSKTATFSGTRPAESEIPAYLRSIEHGDWNRDAVVVFDNGDRVERAGDHAFYIMNAGGSNQKTFTLLFPAQKKS
jgi:hypothetical protein